MQPRPQHPRQRGSPRPDRPHETVPPPGVRRGKRGARKAVGHSMLVAAWYTLADQATTYQALGATVRPEPPGGRTERAELRNPGRRLTANPDGPLF